jgi:hypothetical protein
MSRLNSFQSTVDIEIRKRENAFLKRKEQWQESEEGDAYIQITESLRSLNEDLQRAQDELIIE